MAESAPKAPARWAREQLVACTDGPFVNQWFTKEHWDARLEAARYMHEEKGQRRSACLDYAPTGRTVPHPDEPTAQGAELTHRARRNS